MSVIPSDIPDAVPGNPYSSPAGYNYVSICVIDTGYVALRSDGTLVFVHCKSFDKTSSGESSGKAEQVVKTTTGNGLYVLYSDGLIDCYGDATEF